MGADGNLYEWVGGVDGLGNPVGFWKRLKRLARQAAPFLAPGVPIPGLTGSGLGADDLTQVMGMGEYVGELAEGPDGNLYQWVQGVDGLGNAFGFWKRLRRGLRNVVRKAMPFAQRLAPFIPGGSAALMTATPFLKQAGFAGGGIGALYETPDGSLYQVQGVDADDDINGLEDDDELKGFADDDLSDDGDELRGFADDDMQGYGDDDVQGFEDDDVQGFEDDDMQGYGDDEVQGMDGFVREGVNGLEGFIPNAPRETPWHKAPAQPPPMWSPIW
jgi:hypothetical protein